MSFAFTSGTIQHNAEDLGAGPGGNRVFSGFCRDSNIEGSGCFEGDTDAACPVAGDLNGVPCDTDADCSTPYESCAQRTAGAFSRAAATQINVFGASDVQCLGDAATHQMTLVSVFDIPPTFDPVIDSAYDLPGPGVAILQGTSQFSSSCGDGVVDGSESCDEGSANGTATSCCHMNCTVKSANTPCDDTDGNACTTAACDGVSGNCDQGHGNAPSSTPCADTDGNACTTAGCDGAGNCDQGHGDAPPSTPCAETDGNACTTAGCDGAGTCDQHHGDAATPARRPAVTAPATAIKDTQTRPSARPVSTPMAMPAPRPAATAPATATKATWTRRLAVPAPTRTATRARLPVALARGPAVKATSLPRTA
jgi:hypothetical protein